MRKIDKEMMDIKAQKVKRYQNIIYTFIKYSKINKLHE